MKPDLIKIVKEEEKRIQQLKVLIQERQDIMRVLGPSNVMYEHHKTKLHEYKLEYKERTGREY